MPLPLKRVLQQLEEEEEEDSSSSAARELPAKHPNWWAPHSARRISKSDALLSGSRQPLMRRVVVASMAPSRAASRPATSTRSVPRRDGLPPPLSPLVAIVLLSLRNRKTSWMTRTSTPRSRKPSRPSLTIKHSTLETRSQVLPLLALTMEWTPVVVVVVVLSFERVQ